MDPVDIASFRRRFFGERRAQLERLLDTPLLLYWGRWEGPSIRALTLAEDFTRPAFILCEPGGATTAFVQRIEVDELAPLSDDVELVAYGGAAELDDELASYLKKFDDVVVEVSTNFPALDRLPPRYVGFLSSFVNIRECDDVLVPFRAVKSPLELALMKRASDATLAVFAELEGKVRPGAAEEDLMNFLLHRAIDAGAAPAFYPIVASGPRSQYPHPQRRSKKKIEPGERVVVDYGVDVWGYKADVTRTYVAGGDASADPYYDISAELVDLLRRADLNAVTPLELGREVARRVKDAGLSDRERHGYGHGLGVETHDPHPYVVATAMPWLDRPFEDGMVFTFEPGFYDERGGFRIEDDYVVWKGRAVPMQELDVPA
ncbi:MAG TPA: Xaa-Pro peptidase family protein [bacterium]|nr:Xaa-Pro peptidase family protein [bacterium]